MTPTLLIRHAQSTWNADGRWQGQADPPLSETGRQQTAIAAGRLASSGDYPFDLVVTSGLTRAQETARLLIGHLGLEPEFVVEPGLNEFDVGAWSGLTRDDIERRWPGLLAAFDEGRGIVPPGGESRESFDLRVAGAATRVARLAHSRQSRATLVVSHGGVIRSLARGAGWAEHRVAQLAGFLAEATPDKMALLTPAHLLDPDPTIEGTSLAVGL